MPIVVRETSGPQVPAGTHLAICYRIVDLGTQPDSGFGEKEKVCLFFELPHERITIDGREKPMGISRFYTKSLSKKASLRKDLVSWRGREFTKEELEGFELKNILGKPCQISVVTNENNKSVIDAVVAIPKGMTCPPAQNPLVEYSITEGKNHVYNSLPDWVQKACAECLEWNSTADPEPEQRKEPEAPLEDGSDVPFSFMPPMLPWIGAATLSLFC